MKYRKLRHRLPIPQVDFKLQNKKFNVFQHRVKEKVLCRQKRNILLLKRTTDGKTQVQTRLKCETLLCLYGPQTPRYNGDCIDGTNF